MTTTEAGPLRSFHGDEAVKKQFLDRVHEHRDADRLVQGYGYWSDGKGCAVGCTLELNDHENGLHRQYENQLGLPEWLAHLEDHLFENLPVEAAREWPVQFLSAIPVGVSERSFEILRDRFQIFWLERQKTQIECDRFPEVVEVIDDKKLGLTARLSRGPSTDEAAVQAVLAAHTRPWQWID